jgi:hypothetical protein
MQSAENGKNLILLVWSAAAYVMTVKRTRRNLIAQHDNDDGSVLLV